MNSIAIQVPPGSIDRVRLIRRSMRCFVFGALGLVPVFGVGLALQALRLHNSVREELDDPWQAPPIALYLLGGLLILWLADPRYGAAGDLLVALAVLAAQSWHIYRRWSAGSPARWNPGRHALLGGILFAYAGRNFTIWTVAVTLTRIIKLSTPG